MKHVKATVLGLILIATVILIFSNCTNNGEKKSNRQPDTSPKREPLIPYRPAIKGISQDSLLSYLYESKEVTVNKKARLPFKRLRYNKVIAYEYQGTVGEKVIAIVEESKLASTIKQQKELNQEQVNKLTNLLGANSTYGEGYASCFDPHLGVVFFDGSKIVYHASICLDCNQLRSSIVIPATKAKYIRIGEDFKYPAEGFSKSGSQKIIDLFKELKVGKLK